MGKKRDLQLDSNGVAMSKTEQQYRDSRVDWPVTFDRTPSGQREQTRKFDVTLARSFSDLEDELERLGVDDYDYEFDAKQRQRDKRPYANARPKDPSFVLRWSMSGEQFAIACDRYTRLRDNVRTVGHYLHEKRKMEGRPVETGESEFANARLPSGEEEEEAIVPDPPAHTILGIEANASANQIKNAFRRLTVVCHPDQGGSQEEMTAIKKAKETMLEDLE